MQIDKKSIAILIAVILLFGFLYYYYVGFQPEQGKYDNFAKCLSSKDAVMYGADWCPHCREQKNMFGSSFRFIKYINCDPNNRQEQIEICKKEGIKAYPTWKINGKVLEGTQPLDKLADAAGCSLK
ncbi:MAG: thioredoxin family protein [Candidatus Anstonellales archaeon]